MRTKCLSIAGTNFQTWNSERTWTQDGSNLVDRSCNLRERTMLFVFAWELVKLSIQLWLFASHHQCRIAIIAYIIDTWSIKSNLRGYCYHVLTRMTGNKWLRWINQERKSPTGVVTGLLTTKLAHQLIARHLATLYQHRLDDRK